MRSNFSPKLVSTELRGKRLIGSFVPTARLSTWARPGICRELCAELARLLFLCNTMESPEADNRYVGSLMDHQVMGMILVSAGLKLDPRILRENTAIVLVDRTPLDLRLPTPFSESRVLNRTVTPNSRLRFRKAS